MYFTHIINKREQLSFEDFLNGVFHTNYPKDFFTHYLELDEEKEEKLRQKYDIPTMEYIITTWVRNCEEFTNTKEHYHKFFIPKRTGGMREINAPNDEFKIKLQALQLVFQKQLKTLPHNCAFAYVEHRSTKHSLLRHTKNKSRWFLKVDLQDFFPSCTEEFVYNSLIQIFPFRLFSEAAKVQLKKVIALCSLDGALPQGSPMSPLLSNLIMLPLDFHINKYCLKNKLVYTRYADDLIISKPHSFRFSAVVNELKEILKDTPFKIKDEKTRYGSNAGRNWNLGLMINKDQNVTVGWRKKERFRAMLWSMFMAYKENTPLDLDQVYHIIGLESYYKAIDKEHIRNIKEKYERKTDCEYKDVIKFHLGH